MKKLILAATIGLITSAASAGTVDIATIKCSDLAAMPPESIQLLLGWIDGYMGGQANDTSFDTDRLSSNIDGAAKACEATPDATLMDVLSAAENG